MIRPGCYILLLPLPHGFAGEVGALGDCRLEPGTYAYVGSARNGLDQRLGRHLRREKAMRWHVDRLSVAAERPWALEFNSPWDECELGRRLMAEGAEPALSGFGCSDCRCPTHLFSTSPASIAALRSLAAGIFPSAGDV